MLYTAQAWHDQQDFEDFSDLSAARELLGWCIRCLQLSKLWLSAMTLTKYAAGYGSWLLKPYLPSIRHYFSLRLIGEFTPEQVGQYIPELKDACPSWFLTQRMYQPLPAVELEWSLPVAELREACIQAHTAREPTTRKPAAQTPPLKGVRWDLEVCCELTDDASVTVCLQTSPANIPKGVYYQYRFSLSGRAVGSLNPTWAIDMDATLSCPISSFELQPTHSFFNIGPTAGGWDAVAWANAGLPTDGKLLLKLRVLEVDS